jgi:hypothetical protein
MDRHRRHLGHDVSAADPCPPRMCTATQQHRSLLGGPSIRRITRSGRSAHHAGRHAPGVAAPERPPTRLRRFGEGKPRCATRPYMRKWSSWRLRATSTRGINRATTRYYCSITSQCQTASPNNAKTANTADSAKLANPQANPAPLREIEWRQNVRSPHTANMVRCYPSRSGHCR